MIKLITHDDLDGISCGILGTHFLGDKIDVTYCCNDKVNDEFVKALNGDYDEIWVTDLSINKENADKVEKQNIPVVLLDHHKSALWLDKYSFAKVEIVNDLNQPTCGTELFYNFLLNRYKIQGAKNNNIQSYVERVRRYDTYEWVELNDIQSKNLNDLLGIYGKEQFIENTVIKLNNPKMELFTKFELRLLDIRKDEIRRTIQWKNKTLIKTKFEGYNVGVIFADKFTSEIGNVLCEIHKDIDFIMMIAFGSISLRGKDKVDLSEIAKKFGGGGHFNAAGFPIDTNKITELILGGIYEGL